MLIGLDIGTSGTKAVLFSENGIVLEQSYQEYALSGSGGRLELLPESVFDAVLTVLSDFAASGREIKAIGLSSLGEACVLLDQQEQVLCPAILPGDPRGSAYLPRISEWNRDSWIERVTGLPVNATYSLMKLLWMNEHAPEIMDQTNYIMLFGDYIGYKLTGNKHISESLASRSMLFDCTSKQFSEKLTELAGIEMSMLSKPVQADTEIGTLLPSLAEKTGLPAGVRIFAGGHDQPCAAMGAGVLKKGQAVDSIGTSECITALIGKQPFEPGFTKATNFASEPYLKAGCYNTMAYTHTAGRLLNWFLHQFLNGSGLDYEEMDRRCTTNPSGLLVLPHFSGAGTPTMDHASVGAIMGLRLDSTKEQVYQAIMESVNYEMRLNLELLAENGIRLNQLTAVGGGAGSDVWMQLKANILGIPVSVLECPQASAMGAAMAAAKGIGVYETYEQAEQGMVRKQYEYTPDLTQAEGFRAGYEQYKRLYGAVKSVYKEGIDA